PSPAEFSSLSLHDALPIFPQISATLGLLQVNFTPTGAPSCQCRGPNEETIVATQQGGAAPCGIARCRRVGALAEPVATKNLICRSEEHTSELQSREKLVCR